MAETRYFTGWGNRAEQLGRHLVDWYEMKGYDTQLVECKHPVPGWIVQVSERHDAGWKKSAAWLTGLDTAATVKLIPDSNVLKAEFGSSKWLEKATVAGVGYVMLPPLMLSAAVGLYRQKRLLDEIEQEMVRFVETHTEPDGAP